MFYFCPKRVKSGVSRVKKILCQKYVPPHRRLAKKVPPQNLRPPAINNEQSLTHFFYKKLDFWVSTWVS